MCAQWGILVMILHDVSDVVLEGSKLCEYMQLEVAKDCGFVIFAITFFATRLVMYGTRKSYMRLDLAQYVSSCHEFIWFGFGCTTLH